MKRTDIRQTIVETASKLFYQQGFNSTGVNEIISEAGIAKATLYNHFKSKEDICVSFIKYKNGNFLKDLHAFAETKKSGSSQILCLFDFLEAFFNQKDFNGCWCLNTVSEVPKESKKIREVIISQKKLFLNFILELISKNVKGKSKSEMLVLSKQVYLLYESAVAESHLHESKWPIKEAKNLCAQIIK